MGDLSGQSLGPYKLEKRIGAGGMAEVYLANQPSIGRKVAVKVLLKAVLGENPTFMERFTREVQIIAKLQHPHVLPVYDFGEYEGQPYIVMAYLQGGTLANLIKEKSPIPLDNIVKYTNQVASALDFAHSQGIIHRDFKPSNVLLDHQGYAYLADFGISMEPGVTRLTKVGFVGTLDYMAPEITQEGEITQALDIYALGITVYQMLTGELPYQASTPIGMMMAHVFNPIPLLYELRPDLPDTFQSVINFAIAKDPADRYPTCTALANALEFQVKKSSDYAAPAPRRADLQRNFFYPNLWGRLALEATQAVIGKEQLDALLLIADLPELIDTFPPSNANKSFSFEFYGRITQAIYQIYGRVGSRAVGRRIGKIMVDSTMKAYEGMAKIALAAIKFRSTPAKVKMILEFWAKVFSTMSDQLSEAGESDTHWIYRINRCPVCWGWEADVPVCDIVVGYLEAGLALATGIGQFSVLETDCVAKGDESCLFLIDKSGVT